MTWSRPGRSPVRVRHEAAVSTQGGRGMDQWVRCRHDRWHGLLRPAVLLGSCQPLLEWALRESG